MNEYFVVRWLVLYEYYSRHSCYRRERTGTTQYSPAQRYAARHGSYTCRSHILPPAGHVPYSTSLGRCRSFLDRSTATHLLPTFYSPSTHLHGQPVKVAGNVVPPSLSSVCSHFYISNSHNEDLDAFLTIENEEVVMVVKVVIVCLGRRSYAYWCLFSAAGGSSKSLWVRSEPLQHLGSAGSRRFL